MMITINTDASFSRRHQVGTYAFWIVCDDFRIQKSGLLKEKVKRPEEAELKCIINALHVTFNEDCSMVRKIIINTDCLNAIHVLKNDQVAIREYKLQFGAQLRDSFRSTLNRYHKIEVEFRHVRSHSGTAEKRQWVNDWCDREAKGQMRKVLSLLNNQ